jgi:Ca2+-binding RTX toxin-like protein
MGNYNYTRTELDDTLASSGVSDDVRQEIIATLEHVGVYGTGDTSTAATSIVDVGEKPSSTADVVIYGSDVSGTVNSVPASANAVVFTTENDVDSTIGGSEAKIVVSDAGNDTLTLTGTSADTVYSGDGDDLVSGGDGADTLHGGTGGDELYGEGGSDLVYGDSGSDTLYGGMGADTLYGGTGADELYGDAGNDILSGDSGNDTLYGGAGLDTLYGGAGSDSLYGDAGNDALYGGAGNDTLFGGAGSDTLVGGSGSDVINAGDSDDSVYGGAGDTIIGGLGDDTLTIDDHLASDVSATVAKSGVTTVSFSDGSSLSYSGVEHIKFGGDPA